MPCRPKVLARDRSLPTGSRDEPSPKTRKLLARPVERIYCDERVAGSWESAVWRPVGGAHPHAGAAYGAAILNCGDGRRKLACRRLVSVIGPFSRMLSSRGLGRWVMANAYSQTLVRIQKAAVRANRSSTGGIPHVAMPGLTGGVGGRRTATAYVYEASSGRNSD